jgi:hypothetical protein
MTSAAVTTSTDNVPGTVLSALHTTTQSPQHPYKEDNIIIHFPEKEAEVQRLTSMVTQ